MISIPRILLLALAVVAIAACSSSEVSDTPTAEERFAMGMSEYQDDNWLEAINEFEVIRLQYPGSAVADSARFFTGMCRFNREEYLLASYEFNRLVTGSRTADLADEAYYMYAQCYYEMSPKVQLDQTATERAIDALQSFVEAYPKSPRAPKVEKQVLELVNKLAEKEYDTAILYEKMENKSAALIYFTTVVDRYYNTYFADAAYAGRIRMLIALKKYDDAQASIEEFLERYPDSSYRDDIIGYREDLTDARASKVSTAQ
ncbi:outer membrane protein assembly factor BamD [bacterium]|nr:outer membrane protein assembly factor BamD [bacterium]